MSIGIDTNGSATSASRIYETSRSFKANGQSSISDMASSRADVLVSSRMERLAENYGAASGPMNDGLARLGSRQPASADEVGASALRYNSALEMDEAGYGSDITSNGGAFDVMDKVEAALLSMGRDAVLAQANQLPTGAMS